MAEIFSLFSRSELDPKHTVFERLSYFINNHPYSIFRQEFLKPNFVSYFIGLSNLFLKYILIDSKLEKKSAIKFELSKEQIEKNRNKIPKFLEY